MAEMLHHSTALIAPTAQLADDVFVGPFAVIEDGVIIGEGCRVEAHAQILTGVVMGKRNLIGRGAVIGGEPQSLSFNRSTSSGVSIGDDNIFREHVTIHRSVHIGKHTLVGDHNFLMVGSHLGHDAMLAHHSVLANAVLVAGHVEIGSHCFFGGGSVFHQFIRVGDGAMTQGNSGFSQDLPPWCIGHGINLLGGLNVVGLKRAGYDASQRLALKRAFALIGRSAGGIVGAVEQSLQTEIWTGPARSLLEFYGSPSRKGVCAVPLRAARFS